jgi:chemotaxis response regulator CheB
MKIKKSGGYTIAQDEESSVVYGMNRVAVQSGRSTRSSPCTTSAQDRGPSVSGGLAEAGGLISTGPKNFS